MYETFRGWRGKIIQMCGEKKKTRRIYDFFYVNILYFVKKTRPCLYTAATSLDKIICKKKKTELYKKKLCTHRMQPDIHIRYTDTRR